MCRFGLPIMVGALVGISTPGLLAQDSPGTIAIRGAVRDTAGRPVLGVWVEAQQESSGQRCMIQTDTLGLFTLRLASPGHYWLGASARGLAGTPGYEVSLPADSVGRFDFRVLRVPVINSGPGRQ
jgi:carboxypeptidase family protein